MCFRLALFHDIDMMLVAQLCLPLCSPMDCNPPGSSVHGILQARILEWVAIPTPGDKILGSKSWICHLQAV